MASDWSEQFKSLLSSPLGVEMINDLEGQCNSLIHEAQQSEDQAQAYGLLKKASGVTFAIEHLKFRSIVAPSDEGDK